MDGDVAGNAEVEVVEARCVDAVAADLRGTAGGGSAGAGAHGATVYVAIGSVAGSSTGVDSSTHAEGDGLAAGCDEASGEEEAVDDLFRPFVVLKEVGLVDKAEIETVADVGIGRTVMARELYQVLAALKPVLIEVIDELRRSDCK